MGDDPHFIVCACDMGVGALRRSDHDGKPGFCISQCCIRYGIVIPNAYRRQEVVQFLWILEGGLSEMSTLWRHLCKAMQLCIRIGSYLLHWECLHGTWREECLKFIGETVQHFFLRKKEPTSTGRCNSEASGTNNSIEDGECETEKLKVQQDEN